MSNIIGQNSDQQYGNNMNKYDLILFDYDGTLVNTESAIMSMRANTINYLQLELSNPDYLSQTVSIPLRQILKQLKPEITDAEIKNAYEYSNDFYNQEAYRLSKLYPKTIDFLNLAKSNNIQFVIISNRPQKFLCSDLKFLEIYDLFELIIGLFGYDYPKPNCNVFTYIYENHFTTIQKNKILFVGDTEDDINFAKNCGIDSAYAIYGNGNKQQCLELKPTYVIEKISDLENIVFQQDILSNTS
jgi:HAD superfamily hydrolase (TIGR01549 family)